jgi:CDP-4-dehydro-6-deoxyglucose reductase
MTHDGTRIARLTETRLLSPEIRHFTFEVPEVEHLHFDAGQFVSFTHMIRGKEVTRAYSIASRPAGNRFELCLNLVDDGYFSPYLFGLQPGAEVAMKGPLGTFILRRPVRDTVMVATGTGISPFRGMLADVLDRHRDFQFTLIFGARHEYGLVFADEFREWERECANFRFVPTLTRPGADWTGHTGRVQPLVLDAVGERRDLDVYVCGLRAMVDDVRAILKARGFDRKQIIAEKYD